jgi:hypothetical protein
MGPRSPAVGPVDQSDEPLGRLVIPRSLIKVTRVGPPVARATKSPRTTVEGSGPRTRRERAAIEELAGLGFCREQRDLLITGNAHRCPRGNASMVSPKVAVKGRGH